MNKSYFLLPVLAFVLGCHSGNKPKQHSSALSNNALSFVSPNAGQEFGNCADIRIQVQVSDTIEYDSIVILVDNKKVDVLKPDTSILVWNPQNGKVGTRFIEAILYKKDSAISKCNESLTLMASQPPKYYTYKVKKVFSHDPEAYTQGLVIRDGVLYESTGLYQGNSSLRQTDLTTGKVLKIIKLHDDIFGEGIEVFDNKIIQLSWREHKAILYNQMTFEKISEFSYETEGWGITSDSSHLIMSDGTSNLYFRNKSTFAMIKQIPIYDNHGPVDKLNELEFIDGKIWANVYTTDTIVIINPGNGVVEGKINMTGLLLDTDKNDHTDVLNGIALNKTNGKIYVTGKKWPKLFEVSIQPEK